MIEATLRTARIVVAALAAGPIGFAILAAFVRRDQPAVPEGVAFAVVLAGILAPSIAWRLARRPGDGAPAPGEEEGCRAFLRATVLGLAITEATALAGTALWLAGTSPIALLPTALHAVLVLALWPTEERLQAFLGRA